MEAINSSNGGAPVLYKAMIIRRDATLKPYLFTQEGTRTIDMTVTSDNNTITLTNTTDTGILTVISFG